MTPPLYPTEKVTIPFGRTCLQQMVSEEKTIGIFQTPVQKMWHLHCHFAFHYCKLQLSNANKPTTAHQSFLHTIHLSHIDTQHNTTHMSFDLLLFDLDGTLYDRSCGYEDSIHENILKFLVQATGPKFDEITTMEQAKTVWKPIFQKYNLTKRGLIGEGYVFDHDMYDRFIRQGANQYIPHNDVHLRHFLESLPSHPSRKVIFTNAPEFSAMEILNILGVADLFDAVLGSDFLESKVCKPEREAFEKVLEYCHKHMYQQEKGSDKDESDKGKGQSQQQSRIRPERICFFEDSFKNLKAGKELGFTTVFVSSANLENEGQTKEEAYRLFDAVVEGKVGMSLKDQLPSLFHPSVPQ